MIWLKRALLLILGSLMAVTALLALVYVTFDDSDYRRSLIWIAEHVFDSTLQIDGPLSVRLSRQFALQAEDVTLKANDDRFRLSSKTFSIDILLDYLLSGTLWVSDIRLSQIHLHINESPDSELDWQDFELPPVIVARADFQQIAIEYQEAEPGTLHSIALDSLLLDDVNDQGPVSIRAQGAFEGRPFTLSGSLPSITDVLAHDKPNALAIKLQSEAGHLSIAGTIIDPMDGEGMDLQLDVHANDINRLLEWFTDDVPELGELLMTARMQGSYDTPRLDDVDARLKRNDEVEVTASGSVSDIFTGEGLDLLIESHTRQPTLASWLLTNEPDRLSSLDLKGSLQEQRGRYLVTGVDATVVAQGGLSVTLAGDAELYPRDHALAASDRGLKLTFTMPSLTSLAVFDLDPLPATGAASGQFRLLVSLDAVAVHDADVRVRSREVDATRVRGQVGRIPFGTPFYAGDIDLDVLLTTSSVKGFAEQFGATFADLGSGQAQLQVTGNTDALRLRQVSLQAGYASGLRLTAQGTIHRVSLHDPLKTIDARFKVTAKAPHVHDLSALTDVELPALGALAADGELQVRQATWGLENLRINVGRSDQPTIRLNGNVTSELNIGSTINVDFNVAVADMVAAFTERVPAYLGRLEGNAEISDIDGSMGIERFELQSTQTKLYSVSARGGYDDLKNNHDVNISVDVEVAEPAALGKALDIRLPDLAAYRGQGRFSSTDDVISYHGNVNIGSTRGTTRLQGKQRSGYPTFSGSLSIPLLDLKDFGFELEQDAEHEFVAHIESGGMDDLFSRKPLNFDFLTDFGLDMDIDIDQVESYGRYSIDEVHGKVTLASGNLRIDPLNFIYADGTMDVVLGLKAGQIPELSLQARADDLLLGPALAQVTDGEPVRGRTNLDIDVTATGNSAHALASSLNGNINLEYENARVPKWLLDFLTLDLFGWVLSTALPQSQYYTLNCLVAEFAATDGQLNSKLLVADGPNLAIGGRVDLDLREETIDAVLLPRQKKRLFSAITPVTLSGPIKSPNVVAIPVQAAVQEIGVMAISAPIYLSARILESIWGAIRSGQDVGIGCSEVDKMTDRAEAATRSK